MGTRMPSRSSRMMALRHMRTAGEAPSVRKMCCKWMGGAGRRQAGGAGSQGGPRKGMGTGPCELAHSACSRRPATAACLCAHTADLLDVPLCPNADGKLLLLVLGVLKGLLEVYHPLLTHRHLHKLLLSWSLSPAAAAGAPALLHAASWCCRCLQAPAAPAPRSLHPSNTLLLLTLGLAGTPSRAPMKSATSCRTRGLPRLSW